MLLEVKKVQKEKRLAKTDMHTDLEAVSKKKDLNSVTVKKPRRVDPEDSDAVEV